MIDTPTVDAARRIRDYLTESGYSEDGLNDAVGTSELPTPHVSNLPAMLARTAQPGTLNTLLRLFLLGVPVDRRHAEATTDERFRLDCIECGLLSAGPETLFSEVLLTPYAGLLLASDTFHRLASDENFDHVLAINPTTLHLARFTVPRSVDGTLDIGCGCGLHALLAAQRGGRVVATDLNERALSFTRFNAALNGLDNIECVAGDCYAPVSGRKFDQIVTNPPFVLSPKTAYMYRDNDMPLDSFCRKLVRQAPEHLSEGGFFQMVFEWVELEGQLPDSRIREWTAGTGCDAWLLRANRQWPENYAKQRITEMQLPSEDVPGELKRWLQFYHESGVRAIHGGLLTLRRRAGTNRFRVDPLAKQPEAPLGPAILDGFANHDFLESHASDEQLLAARPRLATDVRLIQDCRLDDGQWQPFAMRLQSDSGPIQTANVDPVVVRLVAGLDGSRTVEDLLPDIEAGSDVAPAQLRAGLARIVRGLLEHGFLSIATNGS